MKNVCFSIFTIVFACNFNAYAMDTESFTEIQSVNDVYPFSTKAVAYKVNVGYYSINEEYPTNDAGIKYGYVTQPHTYYVQKGFDLLPLLKVKGIPKHYALTQEGINENSLWLRVSTSEEVAWMKAAITSDAAELNYTKREQALKFLSE